MYRVLIVEDEDIIRKGIAYTMIIIRKNIRQPRIWKRQELLILKIPNLMVLVLICLVTQS